MPKSITRTYSQYSRDAAVLLGALIREARNASKLTAQELADRAGISRGLLQRIEKGNLKCEIGAVFEVATIVGIKLFEADERDLNQQLRHTNEKLALMPKSVRRPSKKVKDDF
ncbi:MAG: XRE family transcriptional regulator [Desulfobacteraceae bacterium]|nr:MAG: XRE family transcriptional regulator [Desulfobacteraceae bacterium]